MEEEHIENRLFDSLSPYREIIVSTLERVLDIKPNPIGWIHRDEPPTMHQVVIVIGIVRGSDLPVQSRQVSSTAAVA